KLLFACNAGSDEITVFGVAPRELIWLDKISSHGNTPVSLTVHDDLLYVLNAGKTTNISGFRIRNNGHLNYLSQSDRSLSIAAPGGAEIKFNSSGTQLVVTEKNTNVITT